MGNLLLRGTGGFGLTLVAFGAGLAVVGWIWAIVETAKTHRWIWMTAIILTGALGALVYGLFGPKQQST